MHGDAFWEIPEVIVEVVGGIEDANCHSSLYPQLPGEIPVRGLGHDPQAIFCRIMKLTPPKQLTFFISAIAIIAGIIGDPQIGLVGGYADLAFWLLAGGAVLLALSVMVEGL